MVNDMAAPSNTLQIDNPALREALWNTISRIDPMDTPGFSGLTRFRARAYKEEILVDELNVHNTNFVPYGDQWSYSDRKSPERRQFVMGTITEGFSVADEENVSRHAGMGRRVAWEMRKLAIEQRIAIEKMLFAMNLASDTPDNGNSFKGQPASFMAQLETNVQFNSSAATTAGANGGWDDSTKEYSARTDANPTRAFTEKMLKDALNDIWKNAEGGLMGIGVMMNMKQKQVFDTFTGITEFRTNTMGQKQATILAAADTYRHDAGSVRTVLNRHMRDRDIFLCHKPGMRLYNFWMFRTHRRPKEGNNEGRVMTSSFALGLANEKRHGAIFDLS